MGMNKIRLSLFVMIMVTGIVSAQIWRPDHVVIVIEENHAYTQIVGSVAAPYINSLLQDSLAALFTQSYGLTHPSQPNYLMFFSGSNQGIIDDNLPAVNPFNTPNLGNSLITAGFTFTGFSEDLPSVGFNGTTSGYYARKHSPWTNWQGSTNYPIPLVSNQPLTAFPTDYSALPNVSVIIPNLIDDMHNGTDPATITSGDSWLKTHLDGYIQWAKTHNSLFIFTFDEDNSANANRILTFFIGSMVRQGTYAQTNNHYNFLRMLEDMYSLPYSGASSSAVTIDYCWQSALPVELSCFTSTNSGRDIILNWETRTEINLNSYIIQRSSDNKNFQVCGVVMGKGNSNSPSIYSFTDSKVEPGTYYYRLKMTDMNGTYKYSNLTESKIAAPSVWSLNQNYPNPFNPSTLITYTVSFASRVDLKIFNSLGKKVGEFNEGLKEPGYYQVNFNGTGLPSGVYYYRMILISPDGLQSVSSVKKMILLK
jgi:hypothetical protein